MPISMFLKAKLSSIPGGVASLSTPVLDQLSEKLPPSCLRSTTHRGDSSRTRRAPLKGPSQMVYGSCVVRVEFKVLSLSLSPSLSLFVEEGRSTFDVRSIYLNYLELF